MKAFFTEYIVDRITIESTTVKSFYLKPSSGGTIPHFIPGQYVSIRLYMVITGEVLIRSYTLSDSPDKEYLRLTIHQQPQGKFSDYFHNAIEVGDIIPLSLPEGSFTLDTRGTGPVVLLSAGIGITPMLSMAEYIQKNQPERQVHFMHSSRNKLTQVMSERLHQIKDLCSNFHLCLLHSSPLKNEVLDTDYHILGRLTKEMIPEIDAGSVFYICGPNDYIKNIRGYLKDLGLPENKVFFEYFGKNSKEERIVEIKFELEKVDNVTLLKSEKEVFRNKGDESVSELCGPVRLSSANHYRIGTFSRHGSILFNEPLGYYKRPFMETMEEKYHD